jgi:two-component system, response regulator PdtaR
MPPVGNEAGPVILVVEDEELARLIIADYLKEGGFKVLETANAEQALQVLESRADVRAVVLDVVMPGAMDGIALARAIHARWPAIALLVISGKVAPTKAHLPPGTGFLPKPYFGPSIVGRIRAIISGSSDGE